MQKIFIVYAQFVKIKNKIKITFYWVLTMSGEVWVKLEGTVKEKSLWKTVY